jgi:inosose dehydratase
VNYGVLDFTLDSEFILDGPTVLEKVADAGYHAVDLGPVGYLGSIETLAGRLQAHELALSGAWIALPLDQEEALASALPCLDSLLELLDALPPQSVQPCVTLADIGSPARAALPGRAARDRTAGLTGPQWHQYREGLKRVLTTCRDRGYEPSFHPHAGTWIEADWEVERLLADSDVDLCFDPGHLMIGAVEPLAALRSWIERVSHVHIKDAREAAISELYARGADLGSYYASAPFCPLGQGDANVSGCLDLLSEHRYEGWIVVEQDFVPRSHADLERAHRDQLANLRFLSDARL